MSTHPMNLEPKYTAPTQDEIFLQLSETSIKPTLYRAGVDWYSWSYLGEKLWIPPHLEGEPMVEAPRLHPAHGTSQRFKADGRYEIKVRIGDIWDDRPNKGRFNTGVRGIMPGWGVEQVASFALTHHTERGVVLLRGEVEADKLAVAYSRKLVYAAKHAWADEQRKSRAEDVQRFRMNPLNANIPDPPPTPLQRQAQAWLDEFAAADTSQRFKCPHGCSDWSDRSLYVRHMQIAHNETPDPDEKPVEMQAAQLLAEAEKAGEALAAREQDLAKREAAAADREKMLAEQMAALEARLKALEEPESGKKKGAAKG